METFCLRGDYIELVKLLKATGWCNTGGMAKAAVDDGLVLVDGVVELRKGCKLREGQRVMFNQRSIEIITEHV